MLTILFGVIALISVVFSGFCVYLLGRVFKR
jgi:hypothetical protein